MNVFSMALDVAFKNRDIGADATYQGPSDDATVPCRVIFVRPDESFGLGGHGVRAPKLIVDVRVSDIPTVSTRGVFTIAGIAYKVTDPSQPDIQRLTWRASLVPA